MVRTRRLDEETVVLAAMEILDHGGLAALTMRTLATRLGVQAASLYYHVPNRAALLGLVAERIAAEALSDVRVDMGWRELGEHLAVSLRATLRQHPGAAAVVAVQEISPAAFASIVPLVLSAFHAGLDIGDDAALFLAQSLYLLVVGHALAEFGGVPEQPAAPRAYYDEWFQIAISTFLAGIAAQYTPQPRA